MQTVTADAINLKNKQKSSELETNSRRKLQKNKKGKENRITVKNANRVNKHS